MHDRVLLFAAQRESGAYDSERFKTSDSMRSLRSPPPTGLNNFYLSGSEMTLSHAHNLYVNTLVQNGNRGRCTCRRLPAPLRSYGRLRFGAPTTLRRTVWYGALGVYVIVIVAGLTNTTLHHEYDILYPCHGAPRGRLPDKALRLTRGALIAMFRVPPLPFIRSAGVFPWTGRI